ncbi:MAG: mercuric reductase, partial [bacterium]|nr:mercuric reductase [bacterium]
PQVASVGLTEAQARERGYTIRIAVLPVGEAVPRAIVNGTAGIIKLVADAQSGRLLGVHAVADAAGELIGAATLALKFHLTVTNLLETFFPYLTMVEGIKLAAQTFERDVAELSCCAS